MTVGHRRWVGVGLAVVVAAATVALIATEVVSLGEGVAILLAATVLFAIVLFDARSERRVSAQHREVWSEIRRLRRDLDSTAALAEERGAAVSARIDARLDDQVASQDARLDALERTLTARADLDLRLNAATVGLQAAMGRHPLPPLRGWAASPDLLAFLYEHIAATRPQVVLECGTGASTALIAQALEDSTGGRCVSLEHQPEYAETTRQLLRTRGLDDQAVVLTAPLVERTLDDGVSYRWYDLASLRLPGPIDLLFVDGPPGSTGPEARYPAVALLADELAEDATVVLDDADRSDERSTIARWLSLLPDHEHVQLDHEKGTALLRPRRPTR